MVLGIDQGQEDFPPPVFGKIGVACTSHGFSSARAHFRTRLIVSIQPGTTGPKSR
jgi:hypothetical protein